MLRRVDGDLFLPALPVGGYPVDDHVAPLAAASCGGRGAFLGGSDVPARLPPGGWADTTAPAVMTPSTKAAAAPFSSVSIMVLHVLSHKEIPARHSRNQIGH
jgi:hypothetical protein